MKIVIELNADEMVDWLRDNTLVSVDDDMTWISGPFTDVLDAILNNTSVIIEEDADD